MPPMLGGGEMVATFGRDHVEYAAAPHKFEAGTPPILEAIGLVAALDYVAGVGRTTIATHEAALGRHARARFAAIPHITVFGHAEKPGPLLTFASARAHAHDIAANLAATGICAQAAAPCTPTPPQMQ